MSTQETVQKAQQYIQELLGRRNYMDFLSMYTNSKNAFDIALRNAQEAVAQRYENADVSVVDFLKEVYSDARKRLLGLEEQITDIQNARIYLEGDFKPFVEEEVAHREAQLLMGESRK